MSNHKVIPFLYAVIVIAIFSCSKDAGPKKNNPENPNGPASNSLIIQDGSACKFSNTSGENDVSYGFPHDPDRIYGNGTIRVAVLFVDFSDAAAIRSPQDVFGMMSPESEKFISTISHGKAKVVFEPQFKWYRMSKPSYNYGYDNLTFDSHKRYIQEAVTLADPDYDFTNIDEIVIMCNPDGGAITRSSSFMGLSYNGILADKKVVTNVITVQRDITYALGFLFPHEFGHSMGVPDLYSYNGPVSGYVGDFSIMGGQGTAPTYNAWEQWLFGWFTDSQVTCVRGKGTGTIQLTPVEKSDGMKLLVLPINETSAVIVEDRRAIDYDSSLQKEGPLAYVIDTHIKNGRGVLKVLPIDVNDPFKRDAPLSVGQSVTYSGITVKCTASAAGGSTISYERN